MNGIRKCQEMVIWDKNVYVNYLAAIIMPVIFDWFKTKIWKNKKKKHCRSICRENLFENLFA